MRVAPEPTELPKPCLCPVCGDVLSASSAIEPGETAKPRPGDYSMCLQCGAFLIYKPNMQMRIATPKDLRKLDKENLRLLLAARMARQGVMGMFPAKQPERKH